MRLKDTDKLIETIKSEFGYSSATAFVRNMQDLSQVQVFKRIMKLIETAPTVVPEEFMNSYEEGYERAKKDFERITGKCKKCDYRKFTEKFVDGIVDVMNNNGIESVEQLSEIIKGAGK